MPSRSWKTSTCPSVSRALADDRDLDLGHRQLGQGARTASNTIAKATGLLEGDRGRTTSSARPPVRPGKPVAAQRLVAVCGVRPTWPITGMPAPTIAAARSPGRAAALQLTASQPASTNRWAVAMACSFDARRTRTADRRPERGGQAAAGPRLTISIWSTDTGTVEVSRARSLRRSRPQGRRRRRPPRDLARSGSRTP